ncbi:MAG: transposase [Janthinobacterium lividum]
MPFKANAERRHHIPKQRYRVTNSAACDAALRQRGSLTVWFTGAAIAAWKAEPRTTRGGQSRYSALAIATALTLRSVFRLALRQTEGLIGSIIALLGLDLAVPDHTTLSRRAESLDVVCPRPGSGPVHLLVDSTGLNSAVLASDCSRSMARRPGGRGANCILPWTPTLGRLQWRR